MWRKLVTGPDHAIQGCGQPLVFGGIGGRT